MHTTLPPKQRNVLETMRSYWESHGVSPSISVLADSIGISKATTYEHLMALKKKGFLEHIERTGRTWRPFPSSALKGPAHSIPLLGRVAAGVPILAAENVDEYIEFYPPNQHDSYFALRVLGESMIDAHILNGDIVIMRKQDTAQNGDIVVALVDNEEATVKEFKNDKNQILLLPKNPAFKAIELTPERVQILGKVVEIRRKLLQ